MYGPVCTVVWEGEGCEAFPYPDLPASSSENSEKCGQILSEIAAATALHHSAISRIVNPKPNKLYFKT